MNASFTFTDDQRQAIETTGQSVLVSAGAGSGKTAVLAERCAYLVCDAPAPHRCSVDQLLVVTFTEAAAAEMRGRIVEAIRRRGQGHADRAYMETQLRLVGAAQISTIHAFCLYLLRQWFEPAEVDPMAVVLDEHDAEELRERVLQEVLSSFYETHHPCHSPFAGLIETYGLGSDVPIRRFVGAVDHMMRSLPEPEAWLESRVKAYAADRQGWIERDIANLKAELNRQSSAMGPYLAASSEDDAVTQFYRSKLCEYSECLNQWLREADTAGRGPERREALRARIESFEMSARGAPRGGKADAPEPIQRREQIKSQFQEIREKWFQRRLQRRFGRFTAEEYVEAMGRVAPHVTTLARLIRSYRETLSRHKRRLGVLEFSDLEERAFWLLTQSDAAEGVLQSVRSQYRHVLVDEFQDINPLQAAILEAVSTESDDEAPGNLFVVGDIKQSIYRFRLADPLIFQDRCRRLESSESGFGDVIYLQTNFRSDPHLLAGVNALFERLMRGDATEIEFDEHQRLLPGAAETSTPIPIECHIVERRPFASNGDTSNSEAPAHELVDPLDPFEWDAIRRETYFIGRRIQGMMASPIPPGRDLVYSDICILLRAPAHTAEIMVSQLQDMGIPAASEQKGGLFDAIEVRDVLSLLQIIDNRRQDLPLVAVLRSGLLGDGFSADDLMRVRLLNRNVPFHECFLRYAERGADNGLRLKVQHVLQTLDRYREWTRRQPLTAVLWKIFQTSGYFAYVGGLPDGRQRRANLIEFHQLARSFSDFRKQGLHRFLRFIEAMRERDSELSGGNEMGGRNAVTVMSVHQSKGLEFPVVFVTDLGRQFNLSDARNRMIRHREIGLGLRVVERERGGEYPSLLHQMAAERITEQALAEELRVLYVAMTRARRRLILVGSLRMEEIEAKRQLCQGQDRPGSLSLLMARRPLDWIVSALATLPANKAAWSDPIQSNTGGESPLFTITLHGQSEIEAWETGRDRASPDAPNRRLREAVVVLAPLPEDEPKEVEPAMVGRIIDRIEVDYPHLESASIPAVLGVSELERFRSLADPVVEKPWSLESAHPVPQHSAVAMLGDQPADATRLGIITHLVLQHLDFSRAESAERIRDQITRMIAAGWMTSAEAGEIDIESLVWFVHHPLGQCIHAAGESYHREFRFLMRLPASEADPTLTHSRDEPILIRGLIDGIIDDGDLTLIDFKTDRIGPLQIEDRTRQYAVQLNMYARAVERIWNETISPENRYLVFLHPRMAVNVSEQGGRDAPKL